MAIGTPPIDTASAAALPLSSLRRCWLISSNVGLFEGFEIPQSL